MTTQDTAETLATMHFTLATAGHVDHGKTSVLRALTGTDPDRLKEEKEREMTIDLGFAHMRASKNDIEKLDEKLARAFVERAGADAELVVGFVDVPGHGKFLKNMLAGVGGMDMALLVVAADEGVMPQTIQHVKILTLLGVRQCILVMNKTDLADDDQQELARVDAETLLARYGIEILQVVPFSCANDVSRANDITRADDVSRVNDISRANVDTTQSLKDAIVKHILSVPLRDRRHDASGKYLPSFLSIDRVFSKAGHGAVVTGTLTRGTIKIGDEVQIEPGRIGARVRGLQTFNNKLEKAYPGQRLAINLVLKENKTIERGQAVIGGKQPPVDTLIVQLTDLGGLETARDVAGVELKPQNIRFYHGTAERYGVLRWLQPLDVDGAISEPRGNNGIAGQNHGVADSREQSQIGDASGQENVRLRQALIGQIVLTEPVVAGPGEKFVIRYGDVGIAGGEIFLTARPRWLTRAMLKPLAEKIWSGDLAAATLDLINMAPQRSLSAEMTGALLPAVERRRIINQLTESGALEKLGDQLITRDEKNELVKRIEEALADFAESNPRDPAVSQEKLKVEIAPLVDRLVFQNIVRELLSANKLVKVDEKLTLPSVAEKQGGVDASLSDAASKVIAILERNFCIELTEIAAQSGFKLNDVKDALTILERDGKAAIVNYEFASNAKALQKSHEALASVWQKYRNISPGDFREALGVSRKYAMALLAYFDDKKITRRMPNGRLLMKAPPKQENSADA